MNGSILIANRGEIAVRAMRTVKRLGLRSVAVHSDPDTAAPHVALADEAHRLGAGPVAESYLLKERLLEVARESGSVAVFPGYGLLSLSLIHISEPTRRTIPSRMPSSA